MKKKQEGISFSYSKEHKQMSFSFTLMFFGWMFLFSALKELFGLRFMEYCSLIWIAMLIAKYKYDYKPSQATYLMYSLDRIVAVVLIWVRFFT